MLGKTSWYCIVVGGNDLRIVLRLLQEMSLLSLASFCQSRDIYTYMYVCPIMFIFLKDLGPLHFVTDTEKRSRE